MAQQQNLLILISNNINLIQAQHRQMRVLSRKQNKQNNKNFTIICMIIVILILLFSFLLQLKAENEDQAIYIANLNKQIKAEPGVKQGKKQQNIFINGNDIRDQFLQTGKNPYDNILFDTLQNWYEKQTVQTTFKNQKQKGLFNPITPSRSHSIPDVASSQYSSKAPLNADSKPVSPIGKTTGSTTLSRAGVTSQQLQLARKLLDLKNQPSNSQLAIQQKKYYEQKYNVSSYDEQPFCIVIPSFNNVAGDRYIKNMNSILQQDYSNYHMVFFDDMSEDNTGKMMTEYAQIHQISEEKLKIVINKERTMAMPNLYKAAKQYCKPYEIYMIVDGDDELVGRQVFKLFNALFQSKNLWVVYTNFISVRGSIGYSRPYSVSTIERNGYRKAGFVISHLRAFYTKLFSSVKEEDLKDEEGKWFRAANDVAMYMPILEQTHKKVSYFPEITYMYNSNTGLNNHKVKLKEQKGNQKKIKLKPSYAALEELFTQQEKEGLKNSLNRKIEIKDHTLPLPEGQIKTQGWEMQV